MGNYPGSFEHLTPGEKVYRDQLEQAKEFWKKQEAQNYAETAKLRAQVKELEQLLDEASNRNSARKILQSVADGQYTENKRLQYNLSVLQTELANENERSHY